MLTVENIDTLGWERLRRGIEHSLIGVGRDGDAANVLKDQAMILASNMANSLPPKSQAKGMTGIRRDVDKFLSAPIENIESGDSGSVHWIEAGPGFLTGVATEDDWRNADNATAMTVLRLEQHRGKRKKFKNIGVRGKQVARLLQRAVVSPLTRNNVIAILSSHLGRMRASIMWAAHKLGKHVVPEWINRHFPDPPHSHFVDGLSDKANAFVEFGSSAPGIKKFQGRFERSIRRCEREMRKEITRILFGYAKDHNSGKHVSKKHRPTAEEKMNQEMFDAL